MSADRNLLFGILAVQMNFVGRDALIAALNAWVLEKHRPLGDLLQQHGALSPERVHLLDALVAEHLKAHDDDPQKSLAALSCVASLRQSLQQVADDDVQRTVAMLGPAPEADDERPGAALSAAAGQRFRVLRPHAKGGLGEVFVAEDLELYREVAPQFVPHCCGACRQRKGVP